MKEPQKTLPHVQPFVEGKTQPRRNVVDTRGMLSLVTMLVSLAALTLAMIGALKLVLDILTIAFAIILRGWS